MKSYILLIFIFLNFSLYSNEVLGIDSGKKDIILYKNRGNSDTALLILGGIHGDERDTVSVVNYIKDNIETELTMYFIPSINPTLFSKDINRRGYLTEQLDSDGYVKKGSTLTDFNKSLYYRIFYGNENTYKNGIGHYIDPNRDFLLKKLPSTKVLINFLSELSREHKEVIIISFHSYMSGGRIYPEYKIDSDRDYTINPEAWNMAVRIGQGSGFIPEKMYSPAIPILNRFKGEFIAYTGKIEGLTAIDVEIDGDDIKNNKLRSLNGIKVLSNYILEKKK